MVGFLTAQIVTINGVGYTIGGMASFMSGAAMAVAIGYALQAAAAGIVFSGYRRVRLQCAGAGRRSAWLCFL